MRRRMIPSRAAAQRAILEGRVVVSGVPQPKAATLVGGDVALRLAGDPERFVSRGGDKLDGALETFQADVAGRRGLDVGASTGGFTDCLLQRGVASVTALDVGYGQLHWRVRVDPRVTVVERANFRIADIEELGAPFEVVVADVSFISLTALAPALAAAGAAGTDYYLLVKPQFEVGRDRVASGGVVRDRDAHVFALERVAAALAAAGLGSRGVVPSPLLGAKGNREFFLWAAPGERMVLDSELAEAVQP